MRIALANDHAANELKAAVSAHLRGAGHEIVDCGTEGAASVDYPDFAAKAAGMVAKGDAALAILMCGSGIGMSMAANKLPGIRAALLHEPYSARMAREHNDANVLCFGARVTGVEIVKACLDAFLGASFQGGNHARRVAKIAALEGGAGR